MEAHFLLFPGLTQLDLTGPLEVLTSLPELSVKLVARTLDPVTAEGGLRLLPDLTLADAPTPDLLVIPGGGGVDASLGDTELLDHLRRVVPGVKWVFSVCTGALLLGAAGLLTGRRVTTHWTAMEFLPAFGAIPVPERVVEDGNLISGAGVTAGIDAALVVVARLFDERLAQITQLRLEYDPKPPFDSGSPGRADPELVLAVQRFTADRRKRRAEATRLAAERLRAGGGE